MTTNAMASLAIFALLGSSEASAAASKAESVIAAAKRASGGKAWDVAEGCHEEGTRGDGNTPYTTRFSLVKYGMRIDSRQGSMGFDGKVRWRSMGDRIDVRSDADSVREGILTNYLSINGFFFPDRFPATFKYLRTAKTAGGRYDVVEIAPTGGRALAVWFDQRTHLVGRVVDLKGSPPLTVEASDYRTVGGLTVAYRLIGSGPDGKVANTLSLTSFQCGPIDSTIFDPPKPR